MLALRGDAVSSVWATSTGKLGRYSRDAVWEAAEIARV